MHLEKKESTLILSVKVHTLQVGKFLGTEHTYLGTDSLNPLFFFFITRNKWFYGCSNHCTSICQKQSRYWTMFRTQGFEEMGGRFGDGCWVYLTFIRLWYLGNVRKLVAKSVISMNLRSESLSFPENSKNDL